MKFSKIRKITHSLYFRIITGIVMSVLILGTISSVIIINTTDKKVLDLEENFSTIVTESISRTIVYQILFSDPSLLQGTLNSLIDDETVLFAFIVDKNSNITYHTFHPFIPKEIKNINNYLNDIELDVSGYGNINLRSGPIYYGLIGRIVLGVKKTENVSLWIKIILINAFILLLIILITIFILSRNLTTPLFSLIRSLDNQDENGIPIKLIKSPKIEEFKILINTVNNMIINIKESHSQLKIIFDYSLRTIIIITDVDDNIILFNKGAENILGYSGDQLIKKEKYYNIIKEENCRIKKNLLKDEFNEEEWIFRSFYNKEVNVNIIYTHITGKNSEVTGTIFFGQDITQKKCQEKKILEINEKLKLHKENLEIIVDSRTFELQESLKNLEETKDKLVESEKLSSLGGLVAGVAHEINTPVGIGVTAASFLVGETQEFQKLFNESSITKKNMEDYLSQTILTGNIILQNMNKASNLVTSFKQIAVDRTTDGKRSFFIKEYIEEVLLSIHYEIKQSKHEINIYCENDFYITSFPGVLSQILTNLIFNSFIHGLEDIEKGVIDINITNEKELFIIEYKDNGCGIKPDLLSKIYEPFYTTKRANGGTGLGLNIVYNLISSKLNGSIDCISELNKFTKFILRIPHDNSTKKII
ncbi:MAG: PAS domain-containing sensor histidine kinase [Spirochaetaceae bacterium]